MFDALKEFAKELNAEVAPWIALICLAGFYFAHKANIKAQQKENDKLKLANDHATVALKKERIAMQESVKLASEKVERARDSMIMVKEELNTEINKLFRTVVGIEGDASRLHLAVQRSVDLVEEKANFITAIKKDFETIYGRIHRIEDATGLSVAPMPQTKQDILRDALAKIQILDERDKKRGQ